MDKRSLRVEQVELVVETGPSGSDADISVCHVKLDSRSGVGQHAQGSRDLGEVTTGNECGGFVADTELYVSVEARA